MGKLEGGSDYYSNINNDSNVNSTNILREDVTPGIDKGKELANVEKVFLEKIKKDPKFAKKIGNFSIDHLSIIKSSDTGKFLINTDDSKSSFPDIIMNSEGSRILILSDIYNKDNYKDILKHIGITEEKNNGEFSYTMNGKTISIEKAFTLMSYSITSFIMFYKEAEKNNNLPRIADLESIFRVPLGDTKLLYKLASNIDNSFIDKFAKFLEKNNIRYIGSKSENSTRIGADIIYYFSDGKTLKTRFSTKSYYGNKNNNNKDLINGLKKLYNIK